MSDFTDSSIIFQIIDWNFFHEDCEEHEQKQYKIRLFGRTKENKTIYVRVDNFTPFFYIEIDKSMRREQINMLINDVKQMVYPKENVAGLLDYIIEEKHNLYGFTDYSKFSFLKLSFSDYDSFKSYERAFNKPIRYKKYKLFESNIEPLLRCMHIQNIDAAGWVKINKYAELTTNTSWSDINIYTSYTNLIPYECRDIMPITIASFDIECVSEDGSFPQAGRDYDKIIQIGTTFSKFGESDCYYKHIITLGKCKRKGLTIELDFDIEAYLTEKEVLLAWVKLLERMNPDVITGYNILGFDFEYMMLRAKKQGIEKRFSKLSRMKNEECAWIESKLASSALGDNILKYYDMTGRVIIDLMKVAQRDFKLASYKLDYVASSFIKEGVVKLENDLVSIIHTKSTYGIKEEQYITIYYNDSITDNKHMDGKKFKITKIEPNKITVDGLIEDDIMNKGFKVFWCQAKDDISPKDIFSFQVKNPLEKHCKYRTLVAKYCIQDCELVSKLMAKLQILANNIGMSNVCSVPLSYLFKRGQGIKAQSMIYKKCREENHLIPVLKKPKISSDGKPKNKNAFDLYDGKLLDNFIGELNEKDNNNKNNKNCKNNNNLDPDSDQEENNKYEGAIVFPPKKGVYYEPIPVLDYNSLYPSSMIQRNLSHECNVLDDDFDNKYGYLTTYKYHEITHDCTYDFTELYKEFKKENQYIDFLRLIFESFIPRIKLDYSNILEKNKTNIIARYKTANGKILEELLIIQDEKIRDNIKYIIKDSFNNLSSIIKIVMLNIARLSRIFLNKILEIRNNKEKKSFQIFATIFKKKRLWIELEYSKKLEKIKIYKICKFAEKSDGSKGIIPQILINLLNARKRIKNEMEKETDKFMKDILDCYQLAYKCSANSIYGYLGAPVATVYMKDIAASTTATGRELLYYSRYFVEEKFGTFVNLALKKNDKEYFKFMEETFDVYPYRINTYGLDIQIHLEPNVKLPDSRFINPRENYTNKLEYFKILHKKINEILKFNDGTRDRQFSINPKIIYGDTDSVFYNPLITDIETGEIQKDQKSLEIAIELGLLSSDTICKLLPDPQKQAYEKVLYPFIIITKKRYVGYLYETDPHKYYQKSMGIVLKRRDNAPIVKVVVGGIINEIMSKKSSKGAIEYTKKTLNQILMNKYPIDKFIITKTLREKYADRTRIVQAVLADRIGERDAGNKPMPNDRVPYAYIQVDHEVAIQGDRVEHPDYIIKNNLKLDYLFYITNQIMKPSIQFLELLVDKPEKIFDQYIKREQNVRKGFKPVNYYIKDANNNNNNNNNNIFNMDSDSESESESVPITKNIKNKKLIIKKSNNNNNIFNMDSNLDSDSDKNEFCL